jgi:hypothetical protein
MYRRIVLPEAAFQWQAHRWRSWCIALLVLGKSAIRAMRMLLNNAVVILHCFVRVLPLDLSLIFAAVVLVTRTIVGIVPFEKKVRGWGRRHSGVMLAPGITRFLVVPMSVLSVLAA